MKVIVDGDGCAGRHIIEKVCRELKVELIIICNINHAIFSDYAEVKIVDSGFQNVDMHVMNNCQKGDVVVSQDYGVAAMCLSKGAACTSPSGYIFSDKNIDRLLFERHIKSELRRSSTKNLKGTNPRKRNTEDDKRLEESLIKLIKNELVKNG
jgi:Uncharacterized protein conserved in bacteria